MRVFDWWGIYPTKSKRNYTFLTTQSDFPRPLAERGRSVVLEGSSLDHSRCAWRALEATAAAEVAVEVAGIVDIAEVVLVVGRAVGIGVGVVDVVVGQAENTTLG